MCDTPQSANIDTMTYDEFRRQLGKAGLTVKEFAALIKQSPNSVTNYARQGGVPPHLAIMAALMGDMAENGQDFRGVLARIDAGACKPRGKAVKGRFGGNKQMDINLSSGSNAR